MTDSGKDFKRDDVNRSRSIPAWVHILVIVLIVAVVAFVAVKLSIWNKGMTIDTSDVDASEYDVEILDQIFVLPSENREGHKDDGKETILVLGNDAVTYDPSETGICGQIAESTGADVINAGFPGSMIAIQNADYSGDYPLDMFSFYNVTEAMATGDYEGMKTAAGSFTDSAFTKNTELLEGTDLDKVDTLVIFYDASDYIALHPGMNPDNGQDPVTYMGALSAGIKRIQEKYPFIRIVCMSFTFCYAYDSDGTLKNGDRVDFGNGKLTTYLQHMIDTCGDTGVSFVDNYYGTIDEENSSEYLLDNIHVNRECNAHIAEHFAEAIYGE